MAPIVIFLSNGERRRVFENEHLFSSFQIKANFIAHVWGYTNFSISNFNSVSIATNMTSFSITWFVFTFRYAWSWCLYLSYCRFDYIKFYFQRRLKIYCQTGVFCFIAESIFLVRDALHQIFLSIASWPYSGVNISPENNHAFNFLMKGTLEMSISNIVGIVKIIFAWSWLYA